ncbi:transcriptional regulator [Flavicella sediminum]|uniref:hypothetical protein n=1 Tax=Flavicella sediminum TaxID=2585141 RepID=UPI00111E8E81|nr:hypothetical protein [Flavicella sediminum]
MKKLILITLGIIFFSVNNMNSQEEFKKYAKIKLLKKPKTDKDNKLIENEQYNNVSYQVYKVIEVKKKDTIFFTKDYKLSKSNELIHSGIKYSFNKDSIIKENNFKIIYVNKNKIEPLYSKEKKDCFYKANISVSKDSLLINFWLEEIKNKTYYDLDKNKKLIKKNEYTFVPDEKYFIKLRNRESVSFRKNSGVLSALTIPFKYHPSVKNNGITSNSSIEKDINANVFVGYKLGRAKYIYDKYDGMEEKTSGITIGAFIGLSSQKLDSISTSTNLQHLKKDIEVNVASFSYGIGIVGDIRKFELGFFLGFDNALGSIGNKWNFDNKLWLGVGLGYKLDIFKREEN